MDWTLVIVGVGCFIAAFVNAAFATGGVYLVMATATAVFPASIAIPLVPAFSVGSLVGRVAFFFGDIHWRIGLQFAAGAMVGVSLGAMLFSRLPDSVLSIALALIILVLVWLPPSKYIRGNNLPFVPIGIAHAFIGTVLGIGGLLQAFIIRTNLSKAAITGT